MARSTIALCLLCLGLVASAMASESDVVVCSAAEGYTSYKLTNGRLAQKSAKVAGLVAQLVRRVAEEVHMDEACKVKPASRLKSACFKKVMKGKVLDRDDTKAAVSGQLIDIDVIKRIVCPDGSYKVRYEARGIKPANSNKLVGIQTRFIDVFDSTYSP